MNIYEIYIDNQRKNRSIELLKYGFSPLASIFSLFWALYHRMWVIAAFILALNVLTTYLQTGNAFLSVILQLFCILFFGLFANDLRELYLRKSGYDLGDVIAANSIEEAELKFYARKNHYSELIQKDEQQNAL